MRGRTLVGRARHRLVPRPVPDVSDPVVFLHVPKVGGTSYISLLGRLLPGRHWVAPIDMSLTSEAAHRAVDPEQIRGCTLVAGHFDFGICEQASFLRPVTVLRDPIARLVSAYRYGMSEAGADFAWPAYFRKYRISLQDSLRDDDLRSAMTTPAVPQLAGCLWSGAPCGSEAETLARAKRNLSACTHVGIQERLRDSAALLPIDLGLVQASGGRRRWPRPPPLEWLNANAGTPAELPDRLRRTLEHRLSAEYELYRHACAIFEERFALSGLTASPADTPHPIERR